MIQTNTKFYMNLFSSSNSTQFMLMDNSLKLVSLNHVIRKWYQSGCSCLTYWLLGFNGAVEFRYPDAILVRYIWTSHFNGMQNSMAQTRHRLTPMHSAINGDRARPAEFRTTKCQLVLPFLKQPASTFILSEPIGSRFNFGVVRTRVYLRDKFAV